MPVGRKNSALVPGAVGIAFDTDLAGDGGYRATRGDFPDRIVA